jgi:hypothetical protein
MRIAIPIKVLRYAQRLLDQYDRDGDNALNREEAGRMQGEPSQADEDSDGQITVQEMAEHIARYGHGRKIRLMPTAAEYLIQFPSTLNPDADELAAGEPAAASGSSDQPDSAGSPDRVPDRSSAPGFKRFTVPRSRIPEGLPAWFLDRDQDGDCQLTFQEFSPQATAQDRQEFSGYDVNRDGLVTAWEFLGIPFKPRARSVPDATTDGQN